MKDLHVDYVDHCISGTAFLHSMVYCDDRHLCPLWILVPLPNFQKENDVDGELVPRLKIPFNSRTIL